MQVLSFACHLRHAFTMGMAGRDDINSHSRGKLASYPAAEWHKSERIRRLVAAETSWLNTNNYVQESLCAHFMHEFQNAWELDNQVATGVDQTFELCLLLRAAEVSFRTSGATAHDSV